VSSGQVIAAGRFELAGQVSCGGMGTIHRARDRSSGKTVALKLLREDQDTESARRFLQEGHLLAQLAHPAIVRHVAHGQTEGGELYLAMEWIEGSDLAARLKHQPLSWQESVVVARRAALALHAAHGIGVLHRDVKPSNLFLPDGDVARLKLADFARTRQVGPLMTRTGMIVGTPAYMAPEQVRGDRDLGPAAFAPHMLALLAKIVLEQAPSARE
jgi:serine/threonine protein kinase